MTGPDYADPEAIVEYLKQRPCPECETVGQTVASKGLGGFFVYVHCHACGWTSDRHGWQQYKPRAHEIKMKRIADRIEAAVAEFARLLDRRDGSAQ